jgi:ammonia channel protein AmtB
MPIIVLVGAISVHGVVGLWGLLAVPLTNEDMFFTGQLLGALTIFVWVFGASLALWFVIKVVMGVRVSEQEEAEGVALTADCFSSSAANDTELKIELRYNANNSFFDLFFIFISLFPYLNIFM